MDDKKHKDTLLKVANKLLAENVNALKYICSDIGDGILENIKEPIYLIRALEYHGVLGVNNYDKFVELLKEIGREDLVEYFSSEFNILNNERKIPYGGVFQFDLHEYEVCRLVEYKCGKHDNWISISNKKQSCAYYLSRRKKKELFVKVENLLYENKKIDFRFSLQDSKSIFFEYRTFNIAGNYNYELFYNSIMIATPEPIFNKEFNENIKIPNSLDWRKTDNIYFNKVPCNESIESFAQNYMERNFPEINDVICIHSILADKDFTGLVVDKFYHLFSANKTGVCAILPGYPLRYHASLLKCNIESFKNCKDEDRIIVFHSELNLVLIARIATSLDGIKLESENCLNDIILFINVNSPFVEANKLVILGIVVLPSFEHKKLKEELFFLFSDNFNFQSSDLEKILFLCKDDIEDENFEGWWRSVAAYCDTKFSVQSNSTIFFKKLIGLTMILMAQVNHSLPTLESNTQKQIKSLVLNYEQLVAIRDKKLKKIISGGYGSGKSIVGKEIVKNCMTTMTESPLTLFYICCNPFSFFECEMKEFVDSIEKSSNVTVVCDNLYELWKTVCIIKDIKEEYISIPKLLEYLVVTNINKVCFILEELSPDYVKKKDAIQLNKLFSSVLKETLVVFIPESVEKYRVLTRNKVKCLIQKNYFNDEALVMNVFALNKSMRVTGLNKLLIDSSQDSICESNTICNLPNSNVNKISQINNKDLFEKSDQIQNSYSSTDCKDEYMCKLKLNDNFVYCPNDDSAHISNKKVERTFDKTGKEFHEYDYDYVSKHAAIQINDLDSNCVMETSYVFKPSVIGHSIKGEKPMVIYFPFHEITKKRTAKFLSVVLECLCLNILRKTVVICSSMEEVKSVAYAIDIIGKYKSIPYSPHLRKYTPKLADKVEVTKKLKSNYDILVTDSKGFSGVESESVVVLVSPDEYQYLRHFLVDAMARSNSHLIVLILDLADKEFLDNGNIRNVLNNWSEDIVEKIIVHISNKENRLWTIKGRSLIISENCRDFIDRGSQRKFGAYKNNTELRIFHENNSIYEMIAFDIQASKVFKNELTVCSKYGVQPSENLFSREKELDKIHNYLLQDNQNKSVLVLYGMSGVGKTLIVKTYCEIYHNFYKNFVWIDATFGNIKTSMNNICQILGFIVQDSKGDYFDIKVIVEKIHNYYKNEKTLYIFDNVDDESVRILDMYISRKPNSFTLITSQWRIWSNNVNKMLIDVFSSKDAFAFVKKNIKDTDENIRNLIKELGYHPFAICQAIKYIKIHEILIKKYIDRYRLKPLETLDNNNFPTEEESKSAIKAIYLVLLKLEKTKIVPLKILNCLSHCDGQNISKQFIIQISKHIEINDEILIDEAIRLLMSYSLLGRFNEEKYFMHNLTQLSCQYFQNKNSSTYTYFDLIEKYFKFTLSEVKDHIDYGNHFVNHFIYMFRVYRERMSKTFHCTTTSIKHLLICKGLFQEAIEILKAVQLFNGETYGENNKLTLETKINIADCLGAMGKYNEALEINYSIDIIRTEILGINHPSTMETKNNIALCLNKMGKYSEALEIYYSVDKILTEILGINHPTTMTTKNNIALCLHEMGQYNDALEIYYYVDKIQTEILGIIHPSTMETKNNIALCLNKMGKYSEALEIYYSVDKILTEILGINHPTTMTTKNNIALCLHEMGKYNDALEIYYYVDKIQTEILGIIHPSTMETKNNIALCLREMGKYSEALEIYYYVDKIRTEILGIHHPSTMVTKHNIADCLNKMGKFNEALEIYYSVDKIQTEIIGNNHPSTLTTKHNIADCLNKMGKYNEALEIYNSVDKIQIEILGINHPSSMATKNDIALCLLEMGKYREALEIYYYVDKIRTKILGIHHPSTMVTNHNIADCLNKMGKYNEALEIYYSVDKIQTEILGINHPSTMATKNNIALCLHEMGKYNDALEIYYYVDKIRTEILGINHPSTMETKNNIALCLNKMGKYSEALEIYYSVDKVLTEILGINHPTTMTTKNNIALCLHEIGKYNEALEICYSVDKIQTEVIGFDHPSTLTTKHNIANCLNTMGKNNEALEIYYSVDKIQTEIIGNDHPSTLTTKHDIANCLNTMGKYSEALEIYYSVDKIQTEILGINHPSTMAIKNNIANCLNTMGKYSEALEIYYSVDKIQTEILGINHPSTMAIKNNIANCLNTMGKYSEALEIYYSVDKIQTEILGINHPSTMAIKNNIANCFNTMGKYSEALEIYYSVDKIQTEILGIHHPSTMAIKNNIANCLKNLKKQTSCLII
ncbi:uncharacterized protein LOC136085742 isoform X2 [Hydra vulgaris]|uniref:Uncharacterized protein LOC136085742 isoform X2 n=1 Tax=Hydra vulgaris TaxID=6087 RepID=A0ABM4CMZ1_HYDVU